MKWPSEDEHANLVSAFPLRPRLRCHTAARFFHVIRQSRRGRGGEGSRAASRLLRAERCVCNVLKALNQYSRMSLSLASFLALAVCYDTLFAAVLLLNEERDELSRFRLRMVETGLQRQQELEDRGK